MMEGAEKLNYLKEGMDRLVLKFYDAAVVEKQKIARTNRALCKKHLEGRVSAFLEARMMVKDELEKNKSI